MNLEKIISHIELKDNVHTFVEARKLSERVAEYNEWTEYKIEPYDFEGIWAKFSSAAFYADSVPKNHWLLGILEYWGQCDEYSWIGTIFDGSNGRPIIRAYWTEEISVK